MENETNSREASHPIQAKDWIGALAIIAVIAVFYFVIPGFGGQRHLAPLVWLKRSWNHENDFEHGFMVPLISLGLIIWQWKTLRQSIQLGNILGAVVALAGALFFVLAHRTGQARLALGGLPMMLWGAGWFLYGNRVAWQSLFPLFVFWLAIPVPQFQQATMHLQILSTKLASLGCGWLGIETEVRGTQILSLTHKWEPLEIDEGCGGIRSLMALILISSVWAYVSKMALWKKILLCRRLPARDHRQHAPHHLHFRPLGNGLRQIRQGHLARLGRAGPVLPDLAFPPARRPLDPRRRHAEMATAEGRTPENRPHHPNPSRLTS